MQRLMVFFLFAGVLVCTPLPTSAAESPAAAAPPCLEKDKVDGSLTPLDLWKSIATCINTERYDTAVLLYVLAGTRAKFDTLRVIDKSAHEAASALPMLALSSLPREKADAFRAHATNTVGKDASVRKQYCTVLETMGPPNYFPSYMINHGMGAAAKGGVSQQLVVPFDEKASWSEALKAYMKCTT
jgi:hypothetical protein